MLFHEVEPIPDTTNVAKNLSLDRLWLSEKPTLTILLREKNKIMPTKMLLPHESVQCSVLIRDASCVK